MSAFEVLYKKNVNEYTEKKNGLTYLTWSSAWAEVVKEFPEATYEIEKFNGLPYVFDANTGYMVYTKVTINDITHEMWLPVMDSANKAMKAEPYTYKVKDWKRNEYVEKSVEAATMFDINKTIMRCLVKNLAMFGLGLYIYAGEDLPEEDVKDVKNEKVEAVKEKIEKAKDKKEEVKPGESKERVIKFINDMQMSAEKIQKICDSYNIEKITDMTDEHAMHYIITAKKNGVNIA